MNIHSVMHKQFEVSINTCFS